jgi:hypothetical protein
VSVHEVNILGEDISNIKKNPEVLLEASRKVGLEVDTEETKYMVILPPVSEQDYNLLIANKCF